MTPIYWTYAIVLAVVNYPFVVGVDRYVQRHPGKCVFNVKEPVGQRAREVHNSWLTTPIHAILFACFIGSGALRTRSETFTLAIATFVVTFLWTELWHYVSHVAMHSKVLHFIHQEHHRSRITEPWTSVSFSLLEKFIFSFGILGGLAVLSRWQPLSAFGVFSYYVVYFYTNTLGHANFEIREPGYYRRFMGKIFNSPSYHALHHARYVGNYGLITPWLDRLFATEWIDVPEVQTRAASGRPLVRLAERLTAV
jgi:Delta7-sterol 5-desaturase